MQDLNSVKREIASMAQLALSMWQKTHRAFMEHSLELLTEVLTEENKLNDLEKKITIDLVEISRACVKRSEKAEAVVYADVVGDLEMIGDYCKDILERVQIKIEERLLFSDEAVKEYEKLYAVSEAALRDIAEALDKNKPALARAVIKNEKEIKKLVTVYRRRHTQRLVDGVCSPLACNMFLNMLDFTAAIFQHADAVAKDLLKLKAKTKK